MSTIRRKNTVIEPAAREFLPALLEMRDHMPAAGARAVLRSVLALLALSLLWACTARVDVVAVARGHVVPVGGSKPLQSAEGGTVTEIRVQEGERVSRGTVLLRLESAELQAERARLAGELHAERLALAASTALAGLLLDQHPDAAALRRALDSAQGQVGAQPSLRERDFQIELLGASLREHGERLAALDRHGAARDANRRGAAATERRLEQTLPVLEERARSAGTLAARGLVSREQFMERDLARIATAQELAATREELTAITEERAGIAAERDALTQGARRGALADVERHARSVQSQMRDLQRLDERLARSELRAPVTGTVQQLAVRHAGAVLRPAQTALVVVPEDATLEVEAWLPDRDAGFVGPGQKAAIKVEAFEFTRHGLLPGSVRALAAEAEQREGMGTVYAARMALAQDYFDVGPGRAPLVPGMSVQVEIHTGSRRVIDYFLSPLRGAVRDSLRER